MSYNQYEKNPPLAIGELSALFRASLVAQIDYLSQVRLSLPCLAELPTLALRFKSGESFGRPDLDLLHSSEGQSLPR